VAGRLFAVHAERDAWGYLMGSGRTGTRPSVSRGLRESTNDRGPNDGLGREDAFQGLQPSRELRDPPGIAVHDEDLQTRLLVEVGVGRGPDEPEELVLAVEEPMRDHPDFVPVDDRDRPDDMAPALGFEHSYDADHLVAVSNLITRSGSIRKTSLISVSWAAGHMVTAALITVLLYAFRQTILSDVLAHLDVLVAVMLLLIGVI